MARQRRQSSPFQLEAGLTRVGGSTCAESGGRHPSIREGRWFLAYLLNQILVEPRVLRRGRPSKAEVVQPDTGA
jgi:hypothetical protein